MAAAHSGLVTHTESGCFPGRETGCAVCGCYPGRETEVRGKWVFPRARRLCAEDGYSPDEMYHCKCIIG